MFASLSMHTAIRPESDPARGGLEARLGESRFLALDTFSLADIAAFVFVDFARVIRLRIPETHTATRAWFDAIQARPSAQL